MIELIRWLGLALVLLLGPMILIHELGHFLTAKRAGVRVLEFGLGFPPRLLTLAQERGALEVDGMRMVLPPRLRLPKDLEPGQQVEVLTRPEEDGSYHVLRIAPTEAPSGREETSQGTQFRGRLTALEPGTRYSLNLLPIGGFVRMLGEEDPSSPRSLAAQPKRWRLAVLLAGPLLNLTAAFLILTAAFASGVPEHYFVQVEEVVPDTAAEAAGLQPGDILTAVDGERLVDGPEQLRERVLASPEQPLTLSVIRAGEELSLVATPRLKEGHGFLGIRMQAWPDPASLTRHSLPQAAKAAATDLVDVVTIIFRLPRMVATGDVQPAEVRPTGVPGILQLLALFLKQSLEWHVAFPVLRATALISLALGLTNLLPLPALDGGRALFVLIETVRGRRLDPSTEAAIHMVGIVILLTLSAVIIVQDIISPIIPWSVLSR
ncbi:MAG TPA: RIP metalloprotease [Anaerolineales bacterium]|nr:RIP metalloprotease [Anaerolineae bacterium]HIQ01967.1 RIP metalloprotease [Anaerolineales bacterium]